jgi:hypothetical protein
MKKFILCLTGLIFAGCAHSQKSIPQPNQQSQCSPDVRHPADAQPVSCESILSTSYIAEDDPRVAKLSSKLSAKEKLELREQLYDYYNRIIKNSRFTVDRGLLDYLHYMKQDWGSPRMSLSNSLSRLKGNSHVLDLGAGMMKFIEEMLQPYTINYIKSIVAGGRDVVIGSSEALIKNLEENGPPNFTGVTMADFSTKHYTTLEKELKFLTPEELHQNKKINPLIGEYFENIPEKEISGKFGGVDLVVDYYGVLAYTLNLPVVIAKIADVMKPGGDLWMMGARQTVAMRDGRTISIPEYLVETGLFEWVENNGAHIDGMPDLVRRTNKPTYPIDLELESFWVASGGGTPTVVWREANPPAHH